MKGSDMAKSLSHSFLLVDEPVSIPRHQALRGLAINPGGRRDCG